MDSIVSQRAANEDSEARRLSLSVLCVLALVVGVITDIKFALLSVLKVRSERPAPR